MLRKIFSFFVVALVPVAALSSTEAPLCSFCLETVIENQRIYEDDHMIVLYSYKPIIEGHCLILPKRHVERLEGLNQQEVVALHEKIVALYQAAQKAYGATAYLIFQKNGPEAGQSVPHVHFHFLPRKTLDYTDLGLYLRLFLSPFKRPLDQKEMDRQRNCLSDAFKDCSLKLDPTPQFIFQEHR